MTIWVEVLSYVVTVLVGVVFGLLMGMRMYKPKNILQDAAPAADESDDNASKV
jgi:uncharacterized protein YneF (UPF0154 family)